MAKPLIIIYPYLKVEMAFHGHRAEDLGQVLGTKEVTRRSKFHVAGNRQDLQILWKDI